MKCNCIEEINKKLREASGDPEAKLNVIYAFPDMDARICVPYLARDKKRDGTFTKEKDKMLALQKCPFCGTPVDDEVKESPAPGKTS
jgi:hypothetical protein